MTDPFDDSRRLTGSNLYFTGTGAALETARGLAFDDGALDRWRDNVRAARAAIGWPDAEIVIRRHRSGASLAFVAPMDQLYTATEVNEWAWRRALALGSEEESRDLALRPALEGEGFRAEHTPASLKALADAEARPALLALRDAAAARGLPFLPDDDAISIGGGVGSHVWPIDALPSVDAIDWTALHAIPTALITGSNGKTTTVRLIAAMTRAHGWHTAHSCTDGVFFDGTALESGDFSGPMGARTAMRQPQAQAAILEAARGGMLRRGLALDHAQVAVVTNISPDHFGEYGIHDLDDLATVKLTVARAIREDGLLVLNADDPILVRQSAAAHCPLGWFSLDADTPLLVAHRAAGGVTCGVRDGRLVLAGANGERDLGAIAAMPLTLAGRATYNIGNAAAAALAAQALGVPPHTIAAVLARFGSGAGDNPGRLQHWSFGALDVYVDYAHNPEGLHSLLRAIGADARGARRMALLLGHAGNREDEDLRAVASTAAAYRPELVVLKDIVGGYERGRASGEVAAIMRGALCDAGVPAPSIETCLDEVAAARRPLEWARDGDLIVLPVHEPDARVAVVAMLDTLRALDWRPGQPLPQPDVDA